jgi:hypothetical protein
MLDFAQFNALAVQLDLSIFPSQVVDRSIFENPGPVACSIKTTLFIPTDVMQPWRMREESGFRMIRSIDITAPDDGSLNEEFSHCSNGHGLFRCLDIDHPSETSGRESDVRRVLQKALRRRLDCGDDRAFRGAIGVHQMNMG